MIRYSCSYDHPPRPLTAECSRTLYFQPSQFGCYCSRSCNACLSPKSLRWSATRCRGGRSIIRCGYARWTSARRTRTSSSANFPRSLVNDLSGFSSLSQQRCSPGILYRLYHPYHTAGDEHLFQLRGRSNHNGRGSRVNHRSI